jgi:DNA-binding response OmpR family regulator
MATRVLVVDDEPDISNVIKKGLEASGYMVDAFNDPEMALSHFKPDYYDLMIFDIRMPKLNGFKLYREIKKKDSKAKVCFMTAFEMYQKEFSTMFPSYEITCFIKKPVKLTDLELLVRGQLENKQELSR